MNAHSMLSFQCFYSIKQMLNWENLYQMESFMEARGGEFGYGGGGVSFNCRCTF